MEVVSFVCTYNIYPEAFVFVSPNLLFSTHLRKNDIYIHWYYTTLHISINMSSGQIACNIAVVIQVCASIWYLMLYWIE